MRLVSLLTEIQPLPRRLDDEARAAPLRKPARLLVGEGRLRAVAGARRGRVGDASCSRLARRAEGRQRVEGAGVPLRGCGGGGVAADEEEAVAALEGEGAVEP